MKYAKIEDLIIQEVFVPPEGVDISECFHPDIAALFVLVPDEAEVRDEYSNNTLTKYVPPVVEPAPEPRSETESIPTTQV